MKTTHEKALNAFRTLTVIGQKPAKAATSLALFQLKKQLRDAVDFCSEEEQKLIEAAGGHVTDNGMILIADKEKRKEFHARQREVYDSPYEIAGEKVKVSLADLPDVSMEQIESLDDFVEFE